MLWSDDEHALGLHSMAWHGRIRTMNDCSRQLFVRHFERARGGFFGYGLVVCQFSMFLLDLVLVD